MADRLSSICSEHPIQPYILEVSLHLRHSKSTRLIKFQHCRTARYALQLEKRGTKLIQQITEYHNKIITKAFGGNPRLGCYALAVTIFSLGIFRDFL